MVKGHENGIGLVWDSDSDHDTSYQRYQNIKSPHKLSLYLAAELPVILPTFSPFSNFILDNQLGACITDLSELPLRYPQKIDHLLYAISNISG
ncbi:hypothetical protein [Pseudolactococcus paracarnosus]|uniref:hypothetical protein n=1 Tax=Pseudolactococcus paracarnosus TaxID=2749962 RepID=UPI000D403EF5|nr:hypothetical protein [Lactococcus paracarnosus]SPC35703.1 hypothetical protein LPICM02_200036 [Lactococcus piscium]